MTFEEHLRKYLSEDSINSLISSFDKEEQKALLLNTNKLSVERFLNEFPNVKRHPIVPNAFLYNKNEYDFGKLDYFDLGAYYIQEPSAMLVSYLLSPTKDDFVLDLCAAPGGKTTMAALMMNNEGQLISNDLSSSRAQILLSNVERMGLKNVIVTNLDFSTKYKEFNETFDKIILDAPCSGSGMFRRSQEMKDDWSIEKVLANSKVQAQLIEMCSTMLKPGGTLVYSTCSYSYEEDEEIILSFLNNHPEFHTAHVKEAEGFYYSKDVDSIHLFPSLYNGEGHYICLLRKNGESLPYKFSEQTFSKAKQDKNGKKLIENYLINVKLSEKFLDKCLRPGLFKETVTKDGVTPSHHFAKSQTSDNSIELSDEQYKKYIHGDSFNVDAKNGIHFVSYKGMNVGAAKIVNGILKNYYPKGLRR